MAIVCESAGVSFGDYIQKVLLDRELLTFKICLQLVEALEALASLGLVHGDIKPDNILIEGDRPVISDFG